MRAAILMTFCLGASTADAGKVKPLFPVVHGTKLTFAGRYGGTAFPKWSTTLSVGSDGLARYTPHEHVLSYFQKAGFRVAGDGVHIAGETLEGAMAPVRAIAFPLKRGAKAIVPGLIPTTYKVARQETVKVPAGSYKAWRIEISDKPNGKGDVWIAPGVGVVKIKLPSGRIDGLSSIEPKR